MLESSELKASNDNNDLFKLISEGELLVQDIIIFSLSLGQDAILSELFLVRTQLENALEYSRFSELKKITEKSREDLKKLQKQRIKSVLKIIKTD